MCYSCDRFAADKCPALLGIVINKWCSFPFLSDVIRKTEEGETQARWESGERWWGNMFESSIKFPHSTVTVLNFTIRDARWKQVTIGHIWMLFLKFEKKNRVYLNRPHWSISCSSLRCSIGYLHRTFLTLMKCVAKISSFFFQTVPVTRALHKKKCSSQAEKVISLSSLSFLLSSSSALKPVSLSSSISELNNLTLPHSFFRCRSQCHFCLFCKHSFISRFNVWLTVLQAC